VKCQTWPWFTGLIIGCSVYIFYDPQLSSYLVFDREAVLQGAYWRLMTAHLVHFTPSHLFLNLVVFVFVAVFLERINRFNLACLCVMMALGISTLLFFFRPSMQYYAGLSGLIYGLGYYAALLALAYPKPWCSMSVLLLILLPAKVSYAMYMQIDPAIWVEQPFVVMSLSHATGIVIAVFYHILLKNHNNMKL